MKPPYYAVIFVSVRTEGDNGYGVTADRMEELVKDIPGYLGMDHARDSNSITICYWDSLEAIDTWKQNMEHKEAQRMGREKWYASYKLKICKVERDYSFEK